MGFLTALTNPSLALFRFAQTKIKWRGLVDISHYHLIWGTWTLFLLSPLGPFSQTFWWSFRQEWMRRVYWWGRPGSSTSVLWSVLCSSCVLVCLFVLSSYSGIVCLFVGLLLFFYVSDYVSSVPACYLNNWIFHLLIFIWAFFF